MPDMITKKQLSAIKTLVSRLGIDADTEQGLYQEYGHGHAKKLEKWQAGTIITALSKEARKRKIVFAPKSFYGKGERGSQQHITNPQALRIGILKELLGWGDSGLSNFITKQTGKITAVQMLMNYEGVKVITGMTRAMAWKLMLEKTPVKSEGFEGQNRLVYLECYKQLNDSTNEVLKEFYEGRKGNNNVKVGTGSC